MNTADIKKDPAAIKRLCALLTAFFGPVAKSAGLTLRPLSITTLDAMQLAGIAIGSEAFEALSEHERARQLYALIVIQTADLGELGKALRAASGDFEKFYWDFVFAKAAEIPFEAMLGDMQEQLAAEMPAIEAAQVEVITPPSMKAGGEKPPPNS